MKYVQLVQRFLNLHKLSDLKSIITLFLKLTSCCYRSKMWTET